MFSASSSQNTINTTVGSSGGNPLKNSSFDAILENLRTEDEVPLPFPRIDAFTLEELGKMPAQNLSPHGVGMFPDLAAAEALLGKPLKT
jgi:hypothetical protein